MPYARSRRQEQYLLAIRTIYDCAISYENAKEQPGSIIPTIEAEIIRQTFAQVAISVNPW